MSGCSLHAVNILSERLSGEFFFSFISDAQVGCDRGKVKREKVAFCFGQSKHNNNNNKNMNRSIKSTTLDPKLYVPL